MSSLEKHFKVLEKDLVTDPIRISAYHDLPFAIFSYDPLKEYECRRLIRLLAISLKQNHRKRVTLLSLADMLWKAIDETEGMEAIISMEEAQGLEKTQGTINTLIGDPDFLPLSNQITEKLEGMDPGKDVVFLVRTAVLAPALFRCSLLLDQLHEEGVRIPTILFYPGTGEGRTDLRFMNIPARAALGTYNYRMKIYGGNA
jgi:hypothetical protein